MARAMAQEQARKLQEEASGVSSAAEAKMLAATEALAEAALKEGLYREATMEVNILKHFETFRNFSKLFETF
jgi:hypothetical protein